jgi:hypothetical protein
MKKTLLRAMALTVALSFGCASVGFTAGGSIGHGDISVYKSGALVSKLSGQNPIEDGSLLVCDGKCMIKSEGISLIAGDNAQVAVTNETDVFKLYVKEGKVDYIITNNVRKIAFYTPQGTYTVAEVVFNASSQAVVKGSIAVNGDGATEITVTEGRMVFATAEGLKTVDANNKIVLAVDPGDEKEGFTTTQKVVGGGLALLALGGIIYAIDDSNDDDDKKDSGVTPPTSPPKTSPPKTSPPKTSSPPPVITPPASPAS